MAPDRRPKPLNPKLMVVDPRPKALNARPRPRHGIIE